MAVKKEKTKFDYVAHMKKIVDKIRPGQYVLRVNAAVTSNRNVRLPAFIFYYKIVAVEDGCHEELVCPSQYKKLTLVYIGDDFQLPEKAKAYNMGELMPYCQFEIQEKQDD